MPNMNESVKDLSEFKKQLDSLSETLNYFKPNERDKAIQILQECIEGCKNSVSLDQEEYGKLKSSTDPESVKESESNTHVEGSLPEMETSREGPKCSPPREESDFQSEEEWKNFLICPKCKEEFGEKTELIEHLQSHTGKPKSCVDCHKVFNNTVAFRRHKQMAMCVKTGKAFKCDLCNRVLYGESQYNMHVNAHKRNQCRICGDHFSRQKHLETHVITVHKSSLTKDMFRCHICERQFVQRRSLVYHYKLCHPDNEKLCEVCLETFTCTEDLERHLASHKLTTFTCEKCGQSFSRRQQYLLHLKDHERYKCETCGDGFSSKKVAESHVTQGHRVKGLEPQLQCAQCGELFLTRAALNTHMADHTGGKKLSCEKCKITFKRLSNYRNHLESNEHLGGEAPKHLLACEECGKTFTNKNNLRVHISRIHKAKKEYKCTYCEYRTKVMNNLKRHIALHTEKPQFVCDKCGGQYQTKASLQEHHLRCHSETKDFSCDKCGTTFMRSSDLNRHLTSKHSEVPLYSCHCGNGYKTLSNLRRHQLLGHGKVEDKQKQLEKLFPSETKSIAKKKSKKVKDKPDSTVTRNSSDADDLQLLNSEIPVSSVMTEPGTIVVMADGHSQEMLQVSYSMEFPVEDKTQVVYTQNLDMNGLQVEVVDSMINLENDHPKQESDVLIVRNLFSRNDYILPPSMESSMVNNLDDTMVEDIPNIAIPSQKQNVISGLQEYIIPNELNFLNV